MAISTVTLSNTMDWSKRLSFNRNFAIGNSLEPALTSANIVKQTMLSAPFTWWWNAQEISFTASTVAPTATITNIAIAADIVTVTATNNFAINDQVLLSGLTTATFLNGTVLTVLTQSSSQITAYIAYNGTYVSAPDTGTLTKVTTQDYTVSIPNFSHIEHASVYDIFTKSSTTGTVVNKWWELEVKNNLSLDSVQGRPQYVNPHFEDANGNVTFRLQPAPNANYPVSIHCQLAPVQFTSINSTWAPIPDYMQNVYSWGFQALMWAFADDPRMPYASQKFTSGLLARAEGLTEEERNIFLNNWNALTAMDQSKMQQGTQARQV
jgi:hypothetical protein